MSATETQCEILVWSRREKQEGWSERYESILTTLEPVAIMPSGDLGALGVSDEISARQCRPSVAIKTADLYKHKPQSL
ncbi:MAG: hypothetical protein L0Z46_06980 [Nitrospiraceae bacterium]|nr:hypothetical protein [Nitrospiraceae bacterium]